jgi:soluble lytic murein transglycosylase
MKKLLLLLLVPSLAWAIGWPKRPLAPPPRQPPASPVAPPPAAAAPAAPPAPAPSASPPGFFTELDVAPFFAAGDYAKARADLEAERYAAAARGFARATAPEARYLRAVALVQAQRGPEALRALEGLEQKLPDLADRIAMWRGRAQDLAGRDRSAAQAYASVPETSLLWAEAQLAGARSLERSGDRAAALNALAPILSLPPPEEVTRGDTAAEALLLTGQLRARSKAPGDQAWARRAFVECWAGHPLSSVAADCRAELKRLPRPAGGAPTPDDTLRRAEALLDANRNDIALKDLEPLGRTLPEAGPGESLACRTRFALGKAYRRERQHERAMATLKPVVDRCDDPSLRVRALYVLASAASIVAPEDGIAHYLALARDYPANPLADDALFYAADLLARAGRNDQALATLADLSEKYPKGDFRAEALFRTAWIEKQAGHLAGALAALSRLERDYESVDAYEHARAVYWRARILAERNGDGDAAKAREAWSKLADRYPADYYGLLARARLEEAAPGSLPPWSLASTSEASAPEGLSYEVGSLPGDLHFREGVLLLRLGLDRAASDELGAVDRRLLTATGPLLLVAELLDRAGDHKDSHNLIRTVGRSALRQRPEGPLLRAWRVAYPLAFRKEVERWAPKSGVPTDLLLALMREESGLDPTVVSPAGAVGLTQLMVPTAQGVAKKLGMGRVHRKDLMKPPVAIRIGADYFGGLLRRYRGSEALALAAYNVGDIPVKSWLRARGSLPLDVFVEEIPVQETRGYVKRVLRSYAAYRFLYGGNEKPVLIGQALPAMQDR